MESAKLTLKTRIFSQIDRTVKWEYVSERPDGTSVLIEVSHIDKQDGKQILCVPCQSNCAMACKFCHTTGMAGKVAVSNLTVGEMEAAVMKTWKSLWNVSGRSWLISFMGCGEPLTNWRSIVRTMANLSHYAETEGFPIRFALATMLPRERTEDFVSFASFAAQLKLPIKLHLSLHFTKDAQRLQWMPAASDIDTAVNLLKWYRDHTGNPVEIHYTLISRVNDSLSDAWELIRIFQGSGITVKFLHFATTVGSPSVPSSPAWQDFFCGLLERHDVRTECYAPTGADIGSSCGQFAVSDYIDTAASSRLVKIGLPTEVGA